MRIRGVLFLFAALVALVAFQSEGLATPVPPGAPAGGTLVGQLTTIEFSCLAASCGELSTGILLDVYFFSTPTLSYADFVFSNHSSMIGSSIAQVYWDLGTTSLLGLPVSSATYSPGVSMAPGCNPSDLPGGSAISFTASFCFGADSPASKNGINPGETAAFLFNIGDVNNIGALMGALTQAEIRVGAHVISLPDTFSVPSVGGVFVLQPQSDPGVPEPGTWISLGTGLGLLAFARMRRWRS